MTLIELLIVIFGILFSLAIHESGHAFLADRFGDPTARQDGRISLNPFNHWDPVGTTLLIGLLILRAVGFAPFVFGWGKPVPVVERNLNNPRNDQVKIAVFGPISNLLTAVLFALLYQFIPSWQTGIIGGALVLIISINVTLAIFNLLPIPPLDGSHLLSVILPDAWYDTIIRNWSFFIMLIFFVIWFFPSIIEVPIRFITGILIS